MNDGTKWNIAAMEDMFRFIPSREDDSVIYKGEAINYIFQFKSDACLKLCLTPNQFWPSYLNAHL